MEYLSALGKMVWVCCSHVGQLMLLFLECLRYLSRVNFKEMLRQMYKLGVQSLPIVTLTILFTGMVLAIQTSKEFVRFGAAASVGGVVAIAMARELVPVLSGVVVAGRVGAAIAAEIGSMKVTEQIDALRVMAVNPVRYLVVPRVWACLLMLPILVIYGNILGSIGGYFVATNYAQISGYTYLNSIKVFMEFYDLFGGMVKSMFFGVIIAIVGCFRGMHAQQGAEGVGVATTASVVLSIILIFIFNYFLSVLLYV